MRKAKFEFYGISMAWKHSQETLFFGGATLCGSASRMRRDFNWKEMGQPEQFFYEINFGAGRTSFRRFNDFVEVENSM